jgi:hypothetical protein
MRMFEHLLGLARLALEGEEHQAPRVERSEHGSEQRDHEGVVADLSVGGIGRLNDGVLGDIARGEWEAGDR